MFCLYDTASSSVFQQLVGVAQLSKPVTQACLTSCTGEFFDVITAMIHLAFHFRRNMPSPRDTI